MSHEIHDKAQVLAQHRLPVATYRRHGSVLTATVQAQERRMTPEEIDAAVAAAKEARLRKIRRER